MKNNFIIKNIVSLLIPIFIIYVGYIQFYGEESPGGGFQSGLIFSYCFILYKLFFTKTKKINFHVFLRISSFGVLLYFLVGCTSFFYGGFFLDYLIFSKDIAKSRHIGIFCVEFGVFITVFSVMVSIFLIFNDFFKEK